MWRNVHGHAIYQMIVLILIIFIGQIGEHANGLIVYKYDIKCFSRSAETGNCVDGTLNPFYAETHYFDTNTAAYWKRQKETTADTYDEIALTNFSCWQLHEEFPGPEAQLCKTKEDLKAFMVTNPDTKGRRDVNGFYLP